VLTPRARLDGRAGGGQPPDRYAEARADRPETGQARAAQLEAARGRGWELCPPLLPRLGYTTRPALAREMGPPLDPAGPVPHAHSAGAQGGLTRACPRCLAHAGKPWGRAAAGARPRQWPGPGRRGAAGAAALRRAQPARFRLGRVRGRKGDTPQRWAGTHGGRLKRAGRQRWGMGHEPAALRATPRFWRPAALHWESGRVLAPWSERWAAAIVQEWATPLTGVEAAPGRQAEAVTRPCRIRGVAPSLGQQAPGAGSPSESWAVAKGESPCGQQCDARVREAWSPLLRGGAALLARGRNCEAILELVLPA
jgi:hypothetical protein